MGRKVCVARCGERGQLCRACWTHSEQVCLVYLNIFHPTTMKKQRELKAEILSTKAELLQTSAQEQFAKWAKLTA